MPEISDVTDTTMMVSWSPPKSDGGSPIIGYIVERKEKLGTRWTRVNHEPVAETSMKVKDLTDGTVYVYRISAENKAGVGEPSQPSIPTIAKLPYGE